MKLTTKREKIYGNFGSPTRYHFVTSLNGQQITTGDTKEQSEASASALLLGAWDKATSTIHATAAIDGTICISREYQPGEVEFVYCRNGKGGSCMMSNLTIEGNRVTLAEFHAHYVARYNDAVSIRVAS